MGGCSVAAVPRWLREHNPAGAAHLVSPHTLEASYQIPNFAGVAHIRMRLRMRAIGLDVLQDLVSSGDLDPAPIAAMPSFTLHGTAVDYHPRTQTIEQRWPEELRCPDSYRCLPDPESCAR